MKDVLRIIKDDQDEEGGARGMGLFVSFALLTCFDSPGTVSAAGTLSGLPPLSV